MTNLRRYASFLVLSVIFLYLSFLSWNRLGCLIIDTFRDQWAFRAIAHGGVLYKTFSYTYGFLPAYFIGIIYKLCGITLTYTALIGTGIAALSGYFLYRIARIFLDRIFSALLVANFFLVFAFASYSQCAIFNFILPYSVASTFFIFFSLATIYYFAQWLMQNRTSCFYYAYCALICAFLCRFELSLLLWFSLVFTIVVVEKKNKKNILLAALIPLFGIAVYLIVTTATKTSKEFYQSVIQFIFFVLQGKNQQEFYIAGLDNSLKNTLGIFFSFFMHIVFFGLFYAISNVADFTVFHVSKKNQKIPLVRLKHTATLIVSLLAILLTWVFLKYFLSYGNQYKLMPLLLILLVCVSVFTVLYEKNGRSKLSQLTIFLGIFCFLMLLRIFLIATPYHYGFYLLVPSLLCYYVFWIKTYPLLLDVITENKEKHTPYYPIAVFIFFGLFSLSFFQESYATYQSKTAQTATPHGTMRLRNDLVNHYILETVSFLKNQTPESATLCVFPEGLGFNFLANREYPYPYESFLPPIIRKNGEEVVRKHLEKNPADYLVLVARNTPEHGASFFGHDYARSIYAWIQANYTLIQLFGAYPFSSGDFGIAIFKKNDIIPETIKIRRLYGT